MITQFVGTLAMGSGLATSGTLPLGKYTSGHIMMPDAFSGTTLTFNVSPNNVDFRALFDASGQVGLAASIAGSRSYPIPSSVFGASAFFLTAGTVQAAARNFIVCLKGS